MPRRPEKGATIRFLAIVARRTSMAARLCWAVFSAKSRSAGVLVPVRRNSRARSRESAARRACASSPASWAVSVLVSSSTSTSPSRTTAPDSNASRLMRPSNSARTVMPRKLRRLATASSVAVQVSGTAWAVATVTGGGRRAAAAASAFRICRALAPKMPPSTTITASRARAMRSFMAKEKRHRAHCRIARRRCGTEGLADFADRGESESGPPRCCPAQEAVAGSAACRRRPRSRSIHR